MPRRTTKAKPLAPVLVFKQRTGEPNKNDTPRKEWRITPAYRPAEEGITQDQLEQYAEYVKEAVIAERDVAELGAKIMAQIKAGVGSEPGFMRVWVDCIAEGGTYTERLVVS